jgi:hypothetical protein
MRTCLRICFALVLILVVGALNVAQAYAQASADAAVEVDIAPGPLEAALRKLAHERNLQILFAPEDVKGARTDGVKGRLTAKEAIEELIKGTGLTVSSNSNDVYAIKPSANKDPKASAERAEVMTVTGTHLPEGAPASSPVITLARDEIERSGHTP